MFDNTHPCPLPADQSQLDLPRPEDTVQVESATKVEDVELVETTTEETSSSHTKKYGMLSAESSVFAVGLCAALFFLGSFLESKRTEMLGQSQMRSEYQSI